MPFPSPRDRPNSGIEPSSPALQADSFLSESPGKLPTWSPGRSQTLVTFSISRICRSPGEYGYEAATGVLVSVKAALTQTPSFWKSHGSLERQLCGLWLSPWSGCRLRLPSHSRESSRDLKVQPLSLLIKSWPMQCCGHLETRNSGHWDCG